MVQGIEHETPAAELLRVLLKIRTARPSASVRQVLVLDYGNHPGWRPETLWLDATTAVMEGCHWSLDQLVQRGDARYYSHVGLGGRLRQRAAAGTRTNSSSWQAQDLPATPPCRAHGHAMPYAIPVPRMLRSS